MGPNGSKPSSSRTTIDARRILYLFHINLLIHLFATTGSTDATKHTTTGPLPDFAEPIGNQTVAAGRDAQLACKINRLGNYRTAWLRVEDKGILTIHTNIITRNYRIGLLNTNDSTSNFVLTIRNVQPSDRGGYMCQINSVPMRFAVGHLDVLTPPVFEDLQAAASGEPTQNQPRAQQEGRPAPSAQPLAPAPSTPTPAPGAVTVAEGANVTLACRAQGHPAPEITWRREDGEPILLNGAAQTEGVPKVEGQQLALASVSRLSSGAYLCIASNGVPPAASRRQLLDVQFAPVIRLPQTEVGVQLNQPEVRLQCIVELNPLGSYHWVRLPVSRQAGNHEEDHDDDATLVEREQLANSDKQDIVMRQVGPDKVHMMLQLRRLERQDLGHYKCIARNALGAQSTTVRLFESAPGQPATATPPFSLNQLFGGGGAGAEGVARQAGRPAGARAHTRSSWLQRSGQQDSSSAAAVAGRSATGPASSAARPSHAPLHLLLLPLLLLLLNHLSAALLPK